MGFPRVWSIVVAFVAVLAGSAGTACVQHRLMPGSGLATTVEGREWQGYLIVPAREPYRLVTIAGADVEVELDGERVIDTSVGRREARVQRTRGLHELRVTLKGHAERPPKLLWARGVGTPIDIPPMLLVPRVLPQDEVDRRIAVARIYRYAPLAVSLTLIVAATLGGWLVLRRLFEPGLGRPWAWAAVIALFATGLWWGMPDPIGWAADELTPADVREAFAARFGDGWATLYPPLHFAVLAVLHAPFYAWMAAGLADFTDLGAYGWIFITSRAVSLAMALGIVAMVFGLAREIAGTRAAWWASATLVAALPLTYYAKTANLDVPYVFWVTLSMVFYSRAMRDRRPGDFYAFAAAGAVAISTKDQAFAFYVLPALWMAGARVAPVRVLAGMATIVAGGVVVLQNIALNPGGFVEHVRILTGPGSEGFRMFPGTPPGQARLLASSVRLLGDAMSWPLFVAALAAVASASRRRQAGILWLLLPIVSYYVALIAVVGYVYDRFLVGPIVLLAVAAGWWLDRWTEAGVSRRPLRLTLAAVAFAYAFSRVIAIDVMMVRDSRYHVETWLLSGPAKDARVAAAGLDRYLPRRFRVYWQPMQQDVVELQALEPDYVVVNPGFSSRRDRGSRRHEMYEALRAGETAYELALRHRTELWWSPLNLEPRFSGADHEPFSNLTKINPVIEVYRRRTTISVGFPAWSTSIRSPAILKRPDEIRGPALGYRRLSAE